MVIWFTLLLVKGDKHMRAFPVLVVKTINVISIILLKAAQEENES